MSEQRRVDVEIIKLLMQVAWADGSVAPEEATAILEHARAVGLGERALTALDSCLSGKARLPAPDLGFLRQHRVEALAAADKIVRRDAEISDDEVEIIAQIQQLLGDG
jgi:uncharacterized tellurite resistance protein B-like protein